MWLGARLGAVWTARRRYPAEGHEVAGRQAEEDLALIARAGVVGSNWRVWEGLRIPDWEGGRREVDLILVNGNGVLLVEQKHWSGRIEIQGTSLLQHRRTGGVIDHGDVFGKIAHKADVLTWHHGGDEDLRFRMDQVVVFSNSNIEFPEVLSERKDCLNKGDFLNLLPGGGAPIGPELDADMEEICVTLDSLGSWDVTSLNGGKEIHGDVHGISDDAGPLAALIRERRDDIVLIEFDCDRSFFGALVRQPGLRCTVFGSAGVIATCEVNPRAKLTVKPAGRGEVVTHQLCHVCRLVLTSKMLTKPLQASN